MGLVRSGSVCISWYHIERFNDRRLKGMVSWEFVAQVNSPLRHLPYTFKYSWVHWLKRFRFRTGFRQVVFLTERYVVLVRVS